MPDNGHPMCLAPLAALADDMNTLCIRGNVRLQLLNVKNLWILVA